MTVRRVKGEISLFFLNLNKLQWMKAGYSDGTVWGVSLCSLDLKTVGSNPA
jgi:hypothetical protein